MRRTLVGVALLFGLLAESAPAAPPLATCFWEGPISTKQLSTRGFDGRNFNYPEESATYWLARFTLPAGARVVLRGRYPHGRYMSLNAYSEGAPTDTLSDVAVRPRRGATNPFVAGHRRDRRRRAWRVSVVDAPLPSGKRARNTVYAQTGSDAPIELAYRVYEPDRGLDLTGGTGLPRADVVQADGTVLRGQAACAAINDANRDIPVQTIAPELWKAGTSCRPNHPAFDPVRWERFFNLDYATQSVLLDCTEAGFMARRTQQPERKGGLYSNRDTSYVFAHLSTNYGPLVVIRGRLPTFPRTRAGQRRMGSGQLRFWSLCTGESRVTTRTADCLADRQVALTGDRRYTIVVSKPADRPANARRRCGVSWLDIGQGDGVDRSDYAAIVMRNMLVSDTFAEAIQRIPTPAAAETVVGPYFPHSEYSSRADFEALGCPPG
ncbi:MAG: hypothetical protein QOI80_811 [Solirubrobacteraceae bacterium]|nr:hypothetical protein [Solirubrobacteraceae bacterium]